MVRELAALRPRVWLGLTVTVMFSASIFALFTYIAPLLNDITHISPRGVTYTLFLVGIGLTVGNLIGGRLADWRLNATLIGVFCAAAVILVLVAAVAHRVLFLEIALFLWGAIVFAGCSALQINAVNLGRDAPNLISTLNIGAFNAGNALGAWVGGEVISHGLGLGAIPPAAALLALAALGLTLISLLPARRLQTVT